MVLAIINIEKKCELQICDSIVIQGLYLAFTVGYSSISEQALLTATIYHALVFLKFRLVDLDA